MIPLRQRRDNYAYKGDSASKREKEKQKQAVYTAFGTAYVNSRGQLLMTWVCPRYACSRLAYSSKMGKYEEKGRAGR